MASIAAWARRVRTGTVKGADAVAAAVLEGLVFAWLSVWGFVRSIFAAVGRTAAGRTLAQLGRGAFSAMSRSALRVRDAVARGGQSHSMRAIAQPLRYGVRWLDVHQRLYVRRVRRLLRHYLLVLIDPDVPLRRRALHGAKGAGIVGGAAAAVLIVYVIVLIPFTPDRSRIVEAGTQHPSVVVDVSGELITRFRHVNREWIGLEEVSPYFLNALLVTEDRRFFDHSGLDLHRMFGAALSTAKGDVQGGSTLSQQLARNLFPAEIGRHVTIHRKLKELVTALKIEAVYTKEEILESYINTVPFLFNAVGIEMAARTYFGKSATDLDVLESATLVGMLKGTSFYNPVRNPERAVERRNVILHQMALHGSLSSADLPELLEAPVDVSFEVQPIRNSRAPHFTEQIRRWLIEWADEHDYNIYTDSLVVRTTLDLRLQEIAQSAVAEQAEALQAVADVEWASSGYRVHSSNAEAYLNLRERSDPFAYFWESENAIVHSYVKATDSYRSLIDSGVADSTAIDSLLTNEEFVDSLRAERTRLEAGFIAIEPRTGHVRAWVGSRDFEEDQFDHVVQARRQAGSTFKPFLYAAALEEGFSPYHRFTDRPVAIRTGGSIWRPENAGSFSYRDMTLREALTHSVNTVSAQLVDRVGAERVADLARRAGIRSDLDEVPSIALGSSAVTLKEMVTAYATLAAGGIYREPVTVLRVEDRFGNILYEREPPEPEDVISEDVASEIVDMMRGVIEEGTGRRVRFAHGVRTDVAGKTGTTQEGADGWFLLMHPDLVAGAWVGFNDQRITFRSSYWGQGAHTALPMVGEFFREALAHPELKLENEPPPPPKVRYRRVNRRGVGGWLSDVFRGPELRRVVIERPRPVSNLGKRVEEESGEKARAQAASVQ